MGSESQHSRFPPRRWANFNLEQHWKNMTFFSPGLYFLYLDQHLYLVYIWSIFGLYLVYIWTRIGKIWHFFTWSILARTWMSPTWRMSVMQDNKIHWQVHQLKHQKSNIPKIEISQISMKNNGKTMAPTSFSLLPSCPWSLRANLQKKMKKMMKLMKMKMMKRMKMMSLKSLC